MTESGGRQVVRALVAAAWVSLALPGSPPLPVDAAPATPAQDAGRVPTYTADVAPILFGHCVTCHRPGQVAPMSLVTYEDARPWARAVKAKVLSREMPPWHADPRYGEFRNKVGLTDMEVRTLAAWVDAGAPRGDGAAPDAPTFGDGWSSALGRPPDRVIEAPFEFNVPATGDVPTFSIWVKLPFTGEQFVEAIQLLPSNPKVVHHSSVSLGALPPRTTLGRAAVWDGGPVLDGVPVYRDGRPYRAMSGDEFGYPLLFYVPGGGFLKFPEGIGKRIRGGQYLAWGMHHVTTGIAEKNRMRLGLWLSRKRVRHEAVTMTVNERVTVNGAELPRDPQGRPRLPNIPPHAANVEITGTQSFSSGVTLYALWPHMHFRGKDMTFTLRYPDGRQEVLLSVPKYDPNWQVTYELVTPLKIPARSTITAVAHYDNSAGNRYNPAPDEEVTWGPQSANEMFLPFLEVSLDGTDLRFDGFDPLR